MPFSAVTGPAAPDIGRMIESGDLASLTRLLGHADPEVQRQAAQALGRSGEAAVPLLLSALKSRSVPVRIGAAEALGMIRDERAVPSLLDLLGRERSTEVLFGAVLALGEIGSPAAVPPVRKLLDSPNRFIRQGAAITLGKLGWQPESGPDRTRLLIARGEWEAVRDLSADAAAPLAVMLRDENPETREAVVRLMGGPGAAGLPDALRAALRDPEPQVRWRAVLSSLNRGLVPAELPLFVAARTRKGPDPAAAALLNFLFLGIGYNYLGKWWGFPVFMAYMSVLVLAQLALGPFIPYAVAYPVTALLGVQTYYMAERMADGR